MTGQWRMGETFRTIAESAVVDESAVIGANVRIGAFVVIFAGVVIDRDVTIFPNTVIGRPPLATGVVPPKTSRGTTWIGRGCVIGSGVTIYAGSKFGEEVLIADGVRMREDCEVGDRAVIGFNATIQNGVHIGNRSRVLDLSHITAHTQIGDDVFIAPGVTSMNDNSFAHGGELDAPVVESGSAVGGGAVILPGIRLGSESVAAAGAVVTHDVPDRTLVRGVPARESAYKGDEWEWFGFGPGPRTLEDGKVDLNNLIREQRGWRP